MAEAESSSSAMQVDTASAPRSMAPSSAGRTSGKAWKSVKTATKRSHLMPGVKAKSWEDRERKRTQLAALKKIEADLKAEKAAEAEARRKALKERRERHEEKKREEELRAKMSAKKLQRMKKRLGRTKKVNG